MDKSELLVREVTYSEYTNFTSQLRDKGQMGYSDMVAILQEDTLLVVKIRKDKSTLKELIDKYLTKKEVIEIGIEEYNNGVKELEDRVVVDRSFYDLKGFIITGVEI